MASSNHDDPNDPRNDSRTDSQADATLREELQGDPVEPPEGFFQANRWWFASTAFPLLAAAFGPLATLMALCGALQTWVQSSTDASSIGQNVSQPQWLIAVQWLSFSITLVANLFLLLNFGKRLRYSIAQPVTIALWYIACILLIVSLSVTPGVFHVSSSSYEFSQAYFYSIIAASLFFILATLLLASTLGAYVFKAYPPSFNTMTLPQRTLMLQSIVFIFYLAIGALVFARIEDWAYVDSLYWADYTLLTVGIGSDFPFKRNLSRALLIPYGFGGIMTLGLVVTGIRTLILDRGKTKVVRRSIVIEREKWLSRIDSPDEEWKQGEFEAMRSIQEYAETIRKRLQLGFSALAFFGLWLLGALVFMYAEREKQNWSYFRSFYFGYTTLTTIGYGDFYPQSNGGKPFFVIWSLAAVPTVTILITNIGDSAVGLYKSGVLLLGKLSVMPKSFSKKTLRDTKNAAKETGGAQNQSLNQVGDAVQDPNEKPTEEGSLVARIAREIKALSKDMNVADKKYSWEEWNRWLKLLGEAPVSEGNEKEERDARHKRLTRGANNAEWTWLSDDGPLFSSETETEWILGRLCDRLQEISR